MNIRAINVEIFRRRGAPLVYSLNPLTIGEGSFAAIAGLTQGMIEADQHKQRLERAERNQARRAAREAAQAGKN